MEKRGRGRPRKTCPFCTMIRRGCSRLTHEEVCPLRAPLPVNTKKYMQQFGWTYYTVSRKGLKFRFAVEKLKRIGSPRSFKGYDIRATCVKLAEVAAYNFENGPIDKYGFGPFCYSEKPLSIERSWNRLLKAVKAWGVPHSRPPVKSRGARRLGLVVRLDAEQISEMLERKSWQPLPGWSSARA